MAEACYHRPDWVVSREAENRMILYEADRGEVYYLDGSGIELWHWMKERDAFTAEQATRAMQKQFASDRAMVDDIQAVIDDLVEHGLLHEGDKSACR